MRTPLCVVCALMFSTAASGAETASQALAKMPPLAGAATANMDCSAEEATAKNVEAQLRPITQTPMAFGGSAVSMTPAQMQAMTAMSDPAYNECLSQLQTTPVEWVQPLKDKLEAKLQQVEADFRKAVEEHCRKNQSEVCMPDPAISKRFNVQATAAGTQMLKDAQQPYAGHLKEVGDCIAKREKGMGGASGGGNAAMDAIFGSNTGMTWGLVNLPAVTNTRLCKAAREAAGKYQQ